jgi:hypothetical protein
VTKLAELRPVSKEEQKARSLLPWKWFHAPHNLACSLCGEPAAFVCAGTLLPKCERHARDF